MEDEEEKDYEIFHKYYQHHQSPYLVSWLLASLGVATSPQAIAATIIDSAIPLFKMLYSEMEGPYFDAGLNQ